MTGTSTPLHGVSESTLEFMRGLERTRAATLAHFGLADRDLDRTYGPGKWSVRFVLHHLADSESILYYRIRRVISEDDQHVQVFAQELWATALDYATVPMELSRRVYESSRDGVIHFARSHYATSDGRTFLHSELGPRTLKDEFDKVVWHNQKHLDQIAQALAR